MGLHILLLAKLKLFKATSHGLHTPITFLLLGPCILKLVSSFKSFGQVWHDMLHSLRLFCFQTRHIMTAADEPRRGRLQALRSFFEQLMLSPRNYNSGRFVDADEESLRSLVMIPF
ncbi:unnamed protein product [Cuscuta campestris]|uniref:Uncharacterized protein n=1 Tax=Cuscuta campestris TaxID=132261 RepID=A0A484NLQ4_9ASTE|nr:unnamed protein product [Cuscuta campestris]